MKTKNKNCRARWALILGIVFLSLTVGGCANVQHQAKFDQSFKPPEEISIKVTRVSNDTGVNFENDIEKLLIEAFEEKLNEKNLLSQPGKTPTLLLESYIIKYREGSAFKRWLLPGWGATELSIRCDLKDEKNTLVGSAVASREIFAGGLYTIGAWKTVFKDVTDDVAIDLRDQLNAKGYVVKSRQEAASTAGPQLSAKPSSKTDLGEPFTSNLALSSPATPINKIIVNENEPWTGKWRVQGSLYASGLWALKQDGQMVVFTDASYYPIKGKVTGNELEGTYTKNPNNKFRIIISPDGKSFDGHATDKEGTRPIQGIRIE